MRHFLGKLIFADATPVRVQSAVQRIMGGPRLETVAFESGARFECLTSEKYFWFRDAYESDERAELEEYLRADTVLFDIGAHAGFWEVLLHAKCRRIHAFEPSPSNFNRLSRNVAQNKIGNVTLVQAAVSDRQDKLRFTEHGTTSHLSDSGIEVDTIRIDDYVAQNGPPSIVKIDIEGYAGGALRGMKRTLVEHCPALFIELHTDQEVAESKEILQALGYRFTQLGDSTAYPYRARVTIPGRH